MAATSETHAPYMCSVTVPTTAGGTSLATLMGAVYSTLTASTKCRFLSIQVGAAAGASHLYVGNVAATGGTALSATNCGVDLVATQAAWTMNMQSNLILLGDIYLLSSSGSIQVNVTAMVG
jgi:hypothetical protein